MTIRDNGSATRIRERLHVTGAVQGVGFRPFVYRAAMDLGLDGWVSNTAQGVFIEVEGPADAVDAFRRTLETSPPPRATIRSLDASRIPSTGDTGFTIRHSDGSGSRTALILPDIATCPDCLREVMDPSDRRHRYPFTNCTNCGPRFTIIEALPYDRPNTTMRHFPMCDACRAEYENPLDRRFHAQPNACPACGPCLAIWDRSGQVIAERDGALHTAQDGLGDGRIVAVKGLGGFHLMVDARNEGAVRRLRERKRREEKPFALLYPSLEALREHATVSGLEENLLLSPEAPIVLLERRQETEIAPSVAPGNPYIGAMLPYTPLHHLLMLDLGFPVVATSGNLSDEPICTDEREALERLSGIADLFLVHNRPIARHVDDSVARVMAGREMVMRRARGYAPAPVRLSRPVPPILAVGAHLKNTVALAIGQESFGSQHIGDLETPQALDAFRRVITDLETMYETVPRTVACDAHPDYLSTQHARSLDARVIPVQHHYAHVLSCMAEHAEEGPVLGVSWDGTGYGADGTVWGGEFLAVNASGYRRAAHLRAFRLPGGDRAVKEPRRSAMGVLWEILGPELFERVDLAPLASFATAERSIVRSMLERGLNAPVTSSAGRLFDAAASLAGLRQTVRHEGQAAMELEFALHGIATDEAYAFPLRQPSGEDVSAIIDWEPAISRIMKESAAGVPSGIISARFHNGLVEAIVDVARRVGWKTVALSGGCFQNRYLTEHAIRRLEAEGFRPLWHRNVPPNDGGIALGQVLAAARALESKEQDHVPGRTGPD